MTEHKHAAILRAIHAEPREQEKEYYGLVPVGRMEVRCTCLTAHPYYCEVHAA